MVPAALRLTVTVLLTASPKMLSTPALARKEAVMAMGASSSFGVGVLRTRRNREPPLADPCAHRSAATVSVRCRGLFRFFPCAGGFSSLLRASAARAADGSENRPAADAIPRDRCDGRHK